MERRPGPGRRTAHAAEVDGAAGAMWWLDRRGLRWIAHGCSGGAAPAAGDGGRVQRLRIAALRRVSLGVVPGRVSGRRVLQTMPAKALRTDRPDGGVAPRYVTGGTAGCPWGPRPGALTASTRLTLRRQWAHRASHARIRSAGPPTTAATASSLPTRVTGARARGNACSRAPDDGDRRAGPHSAAAHLRLLDQRLLGRHRLVRPGGQRADRSPAAPPGRR